MASGYEVLARSLLTVNIKAGRVLHAEQYFFTQLTPLSLTAAR